MNCKCERETVRWMGVESEEKGVSVENNENMMMVFGEAHTLEKPL